MPVCTRVFLVCRKHRHAHITAFHSLVVFFVLFFLFLTPNSLTVHQVFSDIDDTGVATNETLTTNPKSRNPTITATVVDSIAPSVPILVSPTDESTINTTLPTFIWNPSTDEQGISKYQLWIDGSLTYDSIPTGSTTNSSYTLIVEDGEMKLTPTTALSQGAHTWKVVVYDTSSNTATSATWDFTIDSLAPVTTVTQIGDQVTTITSADSGSVPSTPYELNVNEPTISGTSENGATIQLSVVVPNVGTLTYSTIVVGGIYSFTLPTLPTNEIITFTIVSTDSIGNASTISNVQFIIQPFVIVLPPATPGPTLVPGETPTATPIIEIELPRPTEVIREITTRPEIIQTLLDQITFLAPLIDNPIAQTVAELAPLIAIITPALVATAVTVQTTGSILFPLLELISRILQSLGLIPKRKPRGLVYDTKTGKPVAFVTVTITREGEVETIDSVFTDQDGVYRSIKLPVGVYHLSAIHTEYLFPTQEQRPFGASIYDFYKGEQFGVRNQKEDQFFIIPVDPKNPDSEGYRHRLLLRTFTSSFRRFVDRIFYPMAVFSFIMTTFYPTLWNIGICVFYVVAIYLRLRNQKLEPAVLGTIIDRHEQPIPDVIIRCIETQTNNLRGILFSDEKGNFSINIPAGSYTFVITKDNYILDVQTGDYNNVFVSHENKKDAIQIRMATISEMFPPTQ